ncbi:pilus assembly protein PilP [Pseudomonas putida]
MRAAWEAMAGHCRAFRLGVAVFVALTVMGLGSVVRVPELRQLQTQVEAKRDELSQQQRAKALELLQLGQAQEALRDAQRRLGNARWQLAAGDGMSDLLDQLSASGHAHGLHFERLEVLDELEHAGYRRTPLDIQVVGPYAALRVWLDEWLGQVRLLRSDKLEIASAQGAGGSLRLHLRVHAYHADAPSPATAWLAQLPARAEVVPPALDPFSAGAALASQKGLASIPLTQFQMVGSLARGPQQEALLLSAGRLYRVRPGERLGRDQGVVMRVDEQQMEVREQLLVAGAWRERRVFLTLSKRLGREGTQEHEGTIEMGGGGPVVDPVGAGDPLSG